MRLYRGLRKAEATALFLMRSEVIGLKDWLTRVGVPNVIRRCDCGYPAQTVRHVLLQCHSITARTCLEKRELKS